MNSSFFPCAPEWKSSRKSYKRKKTVDTLIVDLVLGLILFNWLLETEATFSQRLVLDVNFVVKLCSQQRQEKYLCIVSLHRLVCNTSLFRVVNFFDIPLMKQFQRYQAFLSQFHIGLREQMRLHCKKKKITHLGIILIFLCLYFCCMMYCLWNRR